MLNANLCFFLSGQPLPSNELVQSTLKELLGTNSATTITTSDCPDFNHVGETLAEKAGSANSIASCTNLLLSRASSSCSSREVPRDHGDPPSHRGASSNEEDDMQNVEGCHSQRTLAASDEKGYYQYFDHTSTLSSGEGHDVSDANHLSRNASSSENTRILVNGDGNIMNHLADVEHRVSSGENNMEQCLKRSASASDYNQSDTGCFVRSASSSNRDPARRQFAMHCDTRRIDVRAAPRGQNQRRFSGGSFVRERSRDDYRALPEIIKKKTTVPESWEEHRVDHCRWRRSSSEENHDTYAYSRTQNSGALGDSRRREPSQHRAAYGKAAPMREALAVPSSSRSFCRGRQHKSAKDAKGTLLSMIVAPYDIAMCGID